MDDPVALRYAQAAFESAKREGLLNEIQAELDAIQHLVREEPLLDRFLANPDVEAIDKVGVLDRSFGGSWSALVRALVQLIIEAGRAELLPDIVDAFEAMLEQEHRVLRVVVRSAHPLPPALLERVRTALSTREQQSIELSTDVDPALLGGVQIRMGHRVIDASIRRHLDDLRQRLLTVRIT